MCRCAIKRIVFVLFVVAVISLGILYWFKPDMVKNMWIGVREKTQQVFTGAQEKMGEAAVKTKKIFTRTQNKAAEAATVAYEHTKVGLQTMGTIAGNLGSKVGQGAKGCGTYLKAGCYKMSHTCMHIGTTLQHATQSTYDYVAAGGGQLKKLTSKSAYGFIAYGQAAMYSMGRWCQQAGRTIGHGGLIAYEYIQGGLGKVGQVIYDGFLVSASYIKTGYQQLWAILANGTVYVSEGVQAAGHYAYGGVQKIGIYASQGREAIQSGVYAGGTYLKLGFGALGAGASRIALSMKNGVLFLLDSIKVGFQRLGHLLLSGKETIVSWGTNVTKRLSASRMFAEQSVVNNSRLEHSLSKNVLHLVTTEMAAMQAQIKTYIAQQLSVIRSAKQMLPEQMIDTAGVRKAVNARLSEKLATSSQKLQTFLKQKVMLEFAEQKSANTLEIEKLNSNMKKHLEGYVQRMKKDLTSEVQKTIAYAVDKQLMAYRQSDQNVLATQVKTIVGEQLAASHQRFCDRLDIVQEMQEEMSRLVQAEMGSMKLQLKGYVEKQAEAVDNVDRRFASHINSNALRQDIDTLLAERLSQSRHDLEASLMHLIQKQTAAGFAEFDAGKVQRALVQALHQKIVALQDTLALELVGTIKDGIAQQLAGQQLQSGDLVAKVEALLEKKLAENQEAFKAQLMSVHTLHGQMETVLAKQLDGMHQQLKDYIDMQVGVIAELDTKVAAMVNGEQLTAKIAGLLDDKLAASHVQLEVSLAEQINKVAKQGVHKKDMTGMQQDLASMITQEVRNTQEKLASQMNTILKQELRMQLEAKQQGRVNLFEKIDRSLDEKLDVLAKREFAQIDSFKKELHSEMSTLLKEEIAGLQLQLQAYADDHIDAVRKLEDTLATEKVNAKRLEETVAKMLEQKIITSQKILHQALAEKISSEMSKQEKLLEHNAKQKINLQQLHQDMVAMLTGEIRSLKKNIATHLDQTIRSEVKSQLATNEQGKEGIFFKNIDALLTEKFKAIASRESTQKRSIEERVQQHMAGLLRQELSGLQLQLKDHVDKQIKVVGKLEDTLAAESINADKLQQIVGKLLETKLAASHVQLQTLLEQKIKEGLRKQEQLVAKTSVQKIDIENLNNHLGELLSQEVRSLKAGMEQHVDQTLKREVHQQLATHGDHSEMFFKRIEAMFDRKLTATQERLHAHIDTKIEAVERKIGMTHTTAAPKQVNDSTRDYISQKVRTLLKKRLALAKGKQRRHSKRRAKRTLLKRLLQDVEEDDED